MAYESVKNQIDAYIKANGVNLITGPVLNAVLTTMLDDLGEGYAFQGVLNTTDTPSPAADIPQAWLASAGTYLGGSITVDEGELALIIHTADGWSKETVYRGIQLSYDAIVNALGYTPADEEDIPSIADNLTTDDPLMALSAAQGVVLEGEINQLGQKVGYYKHNFSVTYGQYITTATSIAVPIATNDRLTVLVSFPGNVGYLTFRGVKADNSTVLFGNIQPNQVYFFKCPADIVAVNIYSSAASDTTADGVFYVKTELAAGIDVDNTIQDWRLMDYVNKKLFNVIQFNTGKYIRSTGVLADDASGYYSDLIPVVKGDKFKYNGAAYYGQTCIFVCYDIYGNIVSYESTAGTYTDYEIEISSPEVTHIRFGSYVTAPTCTRITTEDSMQTYVDDKISGFEGEIQDLNVRPKTLYNLFDESAATPGYYVKYQDGTLEAASNYYASDYIPVENGKTYTFPVDPNWFGAAGAAKIAMYDSAKNYIGAAEGALDGIINTITINNANAKYIRTTILKGASRDKFKWQQSFDTYMVVNAANYPTRYYPYGEIPQYLDGEFSAKNNELVNPLFGKAVIWDGDSICAAANDTDKLGWAGRISKKNRMMWNNLAVGGGTFTNGGWGTHAISETSYGSANPDYIIIEGGTNDADRIGSILNGQTPSAYGTFSPTGYTDSFSTGTFCGAVEYLFKRLLNYYPKAKIGVIIAQKMGVSQDYTKEGNNRRAYFETLMKLCEKWGIPYINLWDKARLNPRLSAYYVADNPDSFYLDGQHLLPNGYDVITPMIEEWMKTL